MFGRQSSTFAYLHKKHDGSTKKEPEGVQIILQGTPNLCRQVLLKVHFYLRIQFRIYPCGDSSLSCSHGVSSSLASESWVA